MRSIPTVLTAAALMLLHSAQMASATDGLKAKAVLPGVETKAAKDVVGVDPMKTDTAQEPTSQPNTGWVRYGDWDVKISGSVTYDIGTRPLSPNSR